MTVVVLVGAADFTLDERRAGFLVEWIRGSCLTGDEADEMMLACQAVADAVEARLPGVEMEPVEIGELESAGLLTYVLRDYLVQGDEELTALFYALLRFRGYPVLPNHP